MEHEFDPTTDTSTQVQDGTMDLITSTRCKINPTTDKSTGVNASMSLTPQQTQIQGVNGTMDLIISTDWV